VVLTQDGHILACATIASGERYELLAH